MNYKLKIDDINEIFSIFAKDSYGEVRCEDFIRAFKGVHKKMSALAAAGASIIEAKRYKPSFEEVVKDIVEQIEKRRLTNFGPLMKGFDYGNKSLISRNNFSSVLEKLFKAKPGDIGGLGEGDILSVLQHFDPHNLG